MCQCNPIRPPCEIKQLLALAVELQETTALVWAKQTDNSIKEIMLGQALYGVGHGLDNTIKQIKQAIQIEETE